ncbi:MAG: RsmE family RNA methyltransferase [Candidatus Omnitrophota bacterium]
MSKVRIYIPEEETGVNLKIEDRKVLHKIKDVLALKTSEKIYTFDGHGKEYVYEIESINRHCISLTNRQLNRESKETKNKIVLAIPLLKEQKIEYILEKATEMGAAEFQPYVCERSIREKPSQGKTQRWARIIEEATRQSDRIWIPKINELANFDELIKKDFEVKLCASIGGEYIQSALIPDAEKIFLMVGPEGDFSPQELVRMKTYGFTFMKLAENILRVETASIFMVGMVNYLLS